MDYYDILGVTRNASQDELKKAYKKQSMKHHPDRGGDEEQFKKVNEAYATLKDPQKKSEYDNPQPQFGFRGGGQQFHSSHLNADMFEELMRNFGGGSPFQQQRSWKNKDININYNATLEEVFTGKKVRISYTIPSGEQKTLDADLPPGFEENAVIRFNGWGDNTIKEVPPGNLNLRILLKKHARFQKEGPNLICLEKVNTLDLILGTEIIISTLDGNSFCLKVPPGTNPGTTFSMNGQGLPNKRGHKGNLYVTVDGATPKITNEEMLQNIKNIKDGTS